MREEQNLSQIRVIDGPMPPTPQGNQSSLIYQVTMGYGSVITNPSGFGDLDDGISIHPTVIVSEGGQVLSGPPQ